jgi:hypothetical protein
LLFFSDVCSFDRVRENTVLGELEWEWADTVMQRFDPYEFELTREAEILRGFYQAELQRVAEAAMAWRRVSRLREGSEPIFEDLVVTVRQWRAVRGSNRQLLTPGGPDRERRLVDVVRQIRDFTRQRAAEEERENADEGEEEEEVSGGAVERESQIRGEETRTVRQAREREERSRRRHQEVEILVDVGDGIMEVIRGLTIPGGGVQQVETVVDLAQGEGEAGERQAARREDGEGAGLAEVEEEHEEEEAA